MHIIKNKKSSIGKKITSRLLVALALLLMLGGCLTACGGGRATLTIEASDITIPESEAGHTLSKDALTLLAKEITDSKYALEIRERLVAANRGYELSEKYFTDADYKEEENKKELGDPQLDKVGEFAATVLKSERYDLDLPTDYELISAADVNTLVVSMQTKVETEAKMDFFTTIFYWLAQGFAWLIKYPGFGYFALGLVYFSIFVELIMLPMSINQQKNSRKQALLRPKEMAIRKKYAGRTDQVTQQKVAQEIQEMYQREGFNPMSGCLPLILSLIIIIPLYNLVIDPMKYIMGASSDLSTALYYFATTSKAAGGLGMDIASTNGTIELLSNLNVAEVWQNMPHFAFFNNGDACVNTLKEMLGAGGELIPKFTILGQNFGLTPGLSEPWLITVPFLTFASYYGSMKLTRKLSYQPAAQDQATGCSNKMMDFMMPLMSVWFTFMVPAAVGLYWIFKSLIGMVKSLIIAKAMPLPVFTEADFKAAEQEMAAKEKHRPVKKHSGGNPNVRSLHHIDDDEDDLPPVPPRATTYVEEEEPTTEAGGAYLGEATLKEDERPAPKKKAKKAKKDQAAQTTEENAEQDDFASSPEDFNTSDDQ